ITGAGAGGGPQVRVFGSTGALRTAFFAYDPGFTGGVYVAAGAVSSNQHADIVTGAGAGGGPQVRIFNGLNDSLVASFFAYDPNFTGGVRVAAPDFNGTGQSRIV